MGTYTETEKTNIRRHMAYPMYGDEATQGFGHRFMNHYGTLEYRLNHGTPSEEVVVRGYLVQLTQLEADTYGARENIDTAAAAVWTRNPMELAERVQLYNYHRRRLADFFGLPLGPGAGSSNSVQLVV